LEELSREILEAKMCRDDMARLLASQEYVTFADESLEVIDIEEPMDAETSNDQKRSHTSDSENESNAKKSTVKPFLRNEKTERLLSKEQFDVLSPKAKQKISKVLKNSQQPIVFTVKNGQITHRRATDPENPRYSEFKHHVISKRYNN